MFIAALFFWPKSGKQPKCPSHNWWIDKGNVYPHNRILFRDKNEWILTHATIGRNLEHIKLRERSQAQKAIRCMTPFIGNIQKIYRDRKWMWGCRGLGTGVQCKWAWGTLLGQWKRSKTGLWWWLHNLVSLLKVTELYSLKKLHKKVSIKSSYLFKNAVLLILRINHLHLKTPK